MLQAHLLPFQSNNRNKIASPTGFPTVSPSNEIIGPFKASGAPPNMFAGVFVLGENSFILGPIKLHEYMPGCVVSSHKYWQTAETFFHNAILSQQLAGEGYSVFKAS